MAWLDEALKYQATDLHLVVGQKPWVRINGKLAVLTEQIVNEADLDSLYQQFCQKKKDFANEEQDWALTYADVRIRGHLFLQRGHKGMALRFLPRSIPTPDALQLPAKLRQLLKQQKGFLLITGPTRSGKTTTLASLLQEFIRSQPLRMITLEEPIEYLFHSDVVLVTQREIGIDTKDWMSGIHTVLRQDPDVIMLGELRDAQTIQAAIRIAEAGHLVLSTMHAMSTVDALYRIVNSYSPKQQAFVQSQLASTLIGITNQRLVYSKQVNKQVAVSEILVNTRAVAHLIRTGQFHQIYSLIQSGQAHGMQTMEADCKRQGVSWWDGT